MRGGSHGGSNRLVRSHAGGNLPESARCRKFASEHSGLGTECEAERDKLKLQVLDLNQQLVLAGTETVQDRCRPLPACHMSLPMLAPPLAVSCCVSGSRPQQRNHWSAVCSNPRAMCCGPLFCSHFRGRGGTRRNLNGRGWYGQIARHRAAAGKGARGPH